MKVLFSLIRLLLSTIKRVKFPSYNFKLDLHASKFPPGGCMSRNIIWGSDFPIWSEISVSFVCRWVKFYQNKKRISTLTNEFAVWFFFLFPRGIFFVVEIQLKLCLLKINIGVEFWSIIFNLFALTIVDKMSWDISGRESFSQPYLTCC